MLQLQKIKSSQQNHTPVSPLSFKKLSISLKFSLMTNQRSVQHIIQNSTNYVATLPKGHIGYIEVPITNEKPKYHQVNDLITLLHNVAHTYHPDIAEPVPLSIYDTPTQDINSSSNHFYLHRIYMKTHTIHDTPYPNIYKVQPTSDTPKSRTFPTLPYSKDNLKLINKYNFHLSDLTDTEFVTL